ncbi:TniB family NTP-binding protein [Hymenobacter sp. GOD-10R]|uniref:TniB family NTP-binding protein n=1 Tax=Hymenobacter sp. GOD-10R TaxID=3093922 RepID=UPI002D7835A0|nr:TniB family NTP-binding protein [Hymenobacter sp. GOD-10R]WRQ28144.1 TniB family NTP-binding protein [Hymenobacter sp. GOD-10R]
MDYLHPKAKAIAQLDAAERIRWLWREQWIGYPQGQYVLDKMTRLLQRPPVHRTENFLLVGDSNNGKSTLMREFCQRHKATIVEEEDGLRAPVLMIEAPPVPEEKRLYNNILYALGAPVRASYHVIKSESQVREHFKQMGVRMLIIDEVHNLLRGNHDKQAKLGTVLKTMTNELHFTFVFVGTEEIWAALRAMDQLGSRFQSVCLPRWQIDEDYLRLLDTFEYRLPLRKASMLSEPKLAMDILAKTEGLFGEIHNLLCTAAEAAISNGQECITLQLLSNLDWTSPSERHRRARGAITI